MLTNYLPATATSFVGRAEELSSIATLFGDPNCRLLTLVGPGGIGKTRLALQAAIDQRPYYAQGVFFVPLASVTSPSLIVPAVASALQLTFYGTDEIVHYLREKQMLLVMDNFEHLLAGSDLLIDILQSAPDVKFLVTSRERLNVQEEWALTLDGLRAPDDNAAEPLENYGAVQLFVQRARQVQANFSLSENAEAVRTICQRVEGMPLGLELAAAWLRAMSCRQIAAQMESSLDFLTTSLRNVPERHRSLRTVFEQSWALLSEDEQEVLMRVSVFRGGFDLEAAEQVASATLPLLVGLVDKSLIRLSDSEHYDLHELLRQFAAGKLTADEVRATSDRHLAYCLKLAEEAETHIWGRDQQIWYDRLELELDNLRAALAWALAGGQAEMGLGLAGALGWLFIERSRPSEGLAWLEQMLAVNENAPASLRAKALNRAGEIAGLLSEPHRAQALCEEALSLARSVNDRSNIAWALSNLGYYPGLKRNPDQATLALLEQSIDLFRELDDAMGLNHTLRRFAQIVIDQSDYDRARPLLEEALTCALETGDKNAIAQTHLSMGDIAWFRDNDLGQAILHYKISLDLFREHRNRLGMIYALSILGEIAQLQGNNVPSEIFYREALVLIRDFAPNINSCKFVLAGMAHGLWMHGSFERAATLYGAVENIFKGDPANDHPMLLLFRNDVTTLRSQLGEAAFVEAWTLGTAMTKGQAVAYALQSGVSPTERTFVPRNDNPQPLIDPLSERELEILRSVAAGRSNRQIAGELYLALGTVKWYLNTINSKLGVTSRTQAVARARDLGLFS